MNWDIIEGNWTHFKGIVRETWGKLSNDPLAVIAGKRDQLEGGLQEAYGILREQADVHLKTSEDQPKDVDKIADAMPEPTKASPSESAKPVDAARPRRPTRPAGPPRPSASHGIDA